jgi:F0F1-type ATP synthase assembly protein I
VLHILSGITELAKYYLHSMDDAALPDIVDTILCLVHSLTTLKLARPLLRGNKTTRAAYQAPAIIRPVLAVVTVIRKDPWMHGAVVKLLHAFLYTRFLIFASKRIRLTKVQSQATIYAQSVFLGAILAIESSGLPGGVAVYIASVGFVMVLNRFVSNHLCRSVFSQIGSTGSFLLTLLQITRSSKVFPAI